MEKSDQSYVMSQKGYAKSLLEHFGIGESKEKITLMDQNLKLKKDEGQSLEDAMKFQQLVGSLIYHTITRLEICYLICVFYQIMHTPTTSHLHETKRNLRYVKGSFSHELWYKRCEIFLSRGFTDINWQMIQMTVARIQVTVLLLGQQ